MMIVIVGRKVCSICKKMVRGSRINNHLFNGWLKVLACDNARCRWCIWWLINTRRNLSSTRNKMFRLAGPWRWIFVTELSNMANIMAIVTFCLRIPAAIWPIFFFTELALWRWASCRIIGVFNLSKKRLNFFLGISFYIVGCYLILIFHS